MIRNERDEFLNRPLPIPIAIESADDEPEIDQVQTSSKFQKFIKIVYEKKIIEPFGMNFSLPIVILIWIPYILLPLLDVITDFLLIGNF